MEASNIMSSPSSTSVSSCEPSESSSFPEHYGQEIFESLLAGYNLKNKIEVNYLLSLLYQSMTKILSRQLDNQVFGPLNSVLCRRHSWALVARDKH